MGTLPENARQPHSQDSGAEFHSAPNVSVITAPPVITILAESAQPPKLLDRVRALIRAKHYSIRTERIYIFWIKRFICFHGKRHPQSMSKVEVEAFLSHLATAGEVAASTQNQALAALLFLYKEILDIKLPWLDSVVRAKRPKKLPVVLTKDEVQRVLAESDGTVGLFLRVLYGTGMRIMECATLRVKDIDFGARSITIRAGKGAKDRVTVLPEGVSEALRLHLHRVRAAHDDELAAGRGDVELPLPWSGNIPRLRFTGLGSTSFRLAVSRPVRELVSSVVITSTRR